MMDPLSVAVGFIVGALTGATGSYLGQKFTDKRRKKESRSEDDAEWNILCSRFPRVIDEMRTDVTNDEFQAVRKFFVKSSKTRIGGGGPRFEYHTDVYPELEAAIAHLEELGYIEDVTPGNCPMYRMREHFVDRLKDA